MEISIKADASLLTKKGAALLSHVAKESIEKRGRFIVALSGGSTPRDMHRTLAKEPCRSQIAWDRTYIFWADERCVPADNPASNYGAAKRDFLDHVPLPADHVYPMPGLGSPIDGALRYQKELIDFFDLNDGLFPIFDLIFLGIGTDGHTASLFPGQWSLAEKERLVLTVKGGNPDVNRLTMTFPVLNHARQVVFLVSGKEKAAVLKAIIEEHGTQFPAQNIQPLNGKLIWLLDREAASLLSREKSHDES